MSRRSPHYKDRMIPRIQELVSSYFRHEVDQARLRMISITKVELSPDLGHAKVFWDTYNLDQREQMASALSALEPRVRKYLAGELKVRHTPTINFNFDAQYMAEMEITKLINQEKN